MKFEYEWTRKDLKKELLSKRYNTNIIYLIIGILIYTYLMYYPITSAAFDKRIVIIGSMLYLFTYLIMLMVSAHIYVFFALKRNDKRTDKAYGTYYVECDDKSISVKINDLEIKYNYKDISKLKVKRNYFFIRTEEDKIGLIFKKKVVREENYNKLLNKIKKEIKL